MKNKIDKEYKDDFDYINAINKFSNKDMLKLALYQEWVKRRYSKPDSKISIIISLLGVLIGAVVLTWKVKGDQFAHILMIITVILLALSIFMMFIKYFREAENEIDKLNAIRNAIEKLTK